MLLKSTGPFEAYHNFRPIPWVYLLFKGEGEVVYGPVDASFLMRIPDFLALMGFFNPVLAQEPNAPSSESLQGLVNLMENPEKREAFVKDLKNLIETKKTLESKEGNQTAGKTEQNGKKQLVVVRLPSSSLKTSPRISKAVSRRASMLPSGYP